MDDGTPPPYFPRQPNRHKTYLVAVYTGELNEDDVNDSSFITGPDLEDDHFELVAEVQNRKKKDDEHMTGQQSPWKWGSQPPKPTDPKTKCGFEVTLVGNNAGKTVSGKKQLGEAPSAGCLTEIPIVCENLGDVTEVNVELKVPSHRGPSSTLDWSSCRWKLDRVVVTCIDDKGDLETSVKTKDSEQWHFVPEEKKRWLGYKPQQTSELCESLSVSEERLEQQRAALKQASDHKEEQNKKAEQRKSEALRQMEAAHAAKLAEEKAQKEEELLEKRYELDVKLRQEKHDWETAKHGKNRDLAVLRAKVDVSEDVTEQLLLEKQIALTQEINEMEATIEQTEQHNSALLRPLQIQHANALAQLEVSHAELRRTKDVQLEQERANEQQILESKRLEEEELELKLCQQRRDKIKHDLDTIRCNVLEDWKNASSTVNKVSMTIADLYGIEPEPE